MAHTVQLEPATQEDLRSDWTRLCDALAAQGVQGPVTAPPSVMAALPGVLRRHNWQASVVLRCRAAGCEAVRVGAPGDRPLGFAVDMGTTKLAGYLVDLQSGKTLGMRGRMNPQIAYGEDVMARIGYAMQSQSHLETLQRAIVGALNEMIAELCAGAGVGPGHVVDMVAVGNTAMHHLFVGLPVEQLGTAPYVAAVAQALDIRAADLGLEIAPGGYVYILPNIAGFVGADHVSMLLASNIPSMDGVVVGLDIGTNTEVTLNANGRLLACSTASGPAFEGAHIRDGMRASEGAIERLRIVDGKVQYQTIEHAPPVGLCGSGILDAVAQLRLAGIVSVTGAMAGNDRTVIDDVHGTAFLVAPARITGHGADILVSRSDVQEIQLAKGAMRAGVKILLEEAGLTEADIDTFIIAGAFGSYIDVESAVAIGMFPPLPRDALPAGGQLVGDGRAAMPGLPV
ncbi:MAG: ASKHA domain-containing protein [Anaerolineae bacterium]|nr:ASKHA domain-containing protein [Anaerolineae bacterium]